MLPATNMASRDSPYCSCLGPLLKKRFQSAEGKLCTLINLWLPLFSLMSFRQDNLKEPNWLLLCFLRLYRAGFCGEASTALGEGDECCKRQNSALLRVQALCADAERSMGHYMLVNIKQAVYSVYAVKFFH